MFSQELIKTAEKVNDQLASMRRAERSVFISRLKTGKIIVEELLPNIPHGEKEAFITQYLNYPNPRAYQIDVRIWEVFSPYLDMLKEKGIISDTDIDKAGTELSDNVISDSITVFRALSAKMPESAREIAIPVAIDLMARGELTIKANEQVIGIAKTVAGLEPETQKIATNLISNGNLNPTVLNRDTLSQLSKFPELVQEIEESGHLFVPGINGDNPIPASRISRTDLDIVMGRASVELELENQHYWNSEGIGSKTNEFQRWDGSKVFVGGKSHVIKQLQDYLHALENECVDNLGRTYKVIVSRQG